MSRWIGWAGVLALVASLGGCGVGMQQGPMAPSAMQETKLRAVGELYRLHQEMLKKAPQSLKDFNRVGEASSRGAYGAIRSGEVVVRWQATLPDSEAEPTSTTSDEVLAYWKTVPEEGGPVLMLDRSVRKMTAEEFKVARLAGTAEAGPAKSR